jgi:hypothetical protein
LCAKPIHAFPSLDLITSPKSLFALEKQNVLFSQKMMLQSGWDVFENKDGGSIMAMMGSTSEKMYLCQVPNFGLK